MMLAPARLPPRVAWLPLLLRIPLGCTVRVFIVIIIMRLVTAKYSAKKLYGAIEYKLQVNTAHSAFSANQVTA